MRCAALGMRMKARGALVRFVCVGLPDQLTDWLRGRGFDVSVFAADNITDWRADLAATSEVARQVGYVDLLIVDHYGLDFAWESGMRPYTRRILVIDDLADRDHDCDLLLDQNLHVDAQNRYKQHVPYGTIQFLGPRYALLRAEFDDGGLERARDGSVKRLLVFFGGTDPGNQTIKVVDALHALGSRAPESTIVLGPAHPYRDVIHMSVINLPNVQVLDATDRMSMLMAQADLAIGTCGVAAWERCALGLPCLVVVTAENQREDAEILHRLGAVEHLGDADEVNAENWENAIRRAMDERDRIQAMALAARDVMVGRRAALAELERVLVDGMH
ncbi:MAG: UDP-2,4-diacetamido-2,4,6-trideoxy-beta-L-altropyranose hydrolase [Sulfuritalea sp.]|nr:UDP-2,4-diacetamido-2,4,6-trideoxy-beta-L-altropyranose hydrolase [Sulfuritalea sp.]